MSMPEGSYLVLQALACFAARFRPMLLELGS